MENASLLSDVLETATMSSPQENQHLGNISELTLKVVYFIVGTVGIADNLFVIVVFALYIRITDKVRIGNITLIKSTSKLMSTYQRLTTYQSHIY